MHVLLVLGFGVFCLVVLVLLVALFLVVLVVVLVLLGRLDRILLLGDLRPGHCGHSLRLGLGERIPDRVAAEGGEHLTDVRELSGDRVTTRRGCLQLALGLATYLLRRRLGAGDVLGSLLVCRLEVRLGLGTSLGQRAVGLRLTRRLALLHHSERVLVRLHRGAELGRRLVPAIGERLLEVGSGSRGTSPLVLVHSLGLFAAGGRLAVGAVEDLVGLLTSSFD